MCRSISKTQGLQTKVVKKKELAGRSCAHSVWLLKAKQELAAGGQEN